MAKPNPTIVAWMLNEIESDLRKLGLWSATAADPALIKSSEKAFCMDVLSFEQWLQFVLLPNARAILEGDQDWPDGSSVAAQAVREFDGVPGSNELIDHLAKFDALFNEDLDDAGFPSWMPNRGERYVGAMPVTTQAPAPTSQLHPAEPPRPWEPLALLPTPIQTALQLAVDASVPTFLIKRDDLTGFELSGNKIRKLEYLISEAQMNGCDTLVTYGGFQSNHCRATAAAGARLGMRVRMFLRSADPNPPRDGNLFLDELFGAEISIHSPEEYSGQRQQIIDRIVAEEEAAGRRPYFFPVGGSVPLGCWGYIRCMHELKTQLDPSEPHDIVVAVGSSGTLAGCVLGKALFGLDAWRVVGIPICDSVDYFAKEVRALVDATIAKYALNLTGEQTPIELVGGYVGEGYALPYPAELDCIRRVARTTGVLLDPTYTGKAMHGLIDSLSKKTGPFRRGATPVFIHTGGAFGLMARRDLFAPSLR